MLVTDGVVLIRVIFPARNSLKVPGRRKYSLRYQLKNARISGRLTFGIVEIVWANTFCDDELIDDVGKD